MQNQNRWIQQELIIKTVKFFICLIMIRNKYGLRLLNILTEKPFEEADLLDLVLKITIHLKL